MSKLNLIPPDNFELVYLVNFETNVFFRIIKNIKSGMIYPEYSDNDCWRNFGDNDMACIPVNNNIPLSNKEIINIFEPMINQIKTIVFIKLKMI